MEQSVYLGLGFQMVRFHDGGVEIPGGKNWMLTAEAEDSQIRL